ncbi:MAG: CRTAC1 family protein [Myxococcales bacterium]|nr:CRTAC1 family protein [Myxococcales bacterium]
MFLRHTALTFLLAVWAGNATVACSGSSEPVAPATDTTTSLDDLPREGPSDEAPRPLRFHDASARLGGLAGGGRGVALVDVDQDGWPDVTTTSLERVHLLRGAGEGLFAPWTEFPVASARGIAWVDVDDDGDLDFFVATSSPRHHLFRNDSGVFTDITAGSGLDEETDHGAEGASFGDLDGDGDLDLFLAFGALPMSMLGPDYVLGDTGAPERVYLNDGNGHFTRHVSELLAGRPGGETFQGYLYDADRDGDVDIFSVHDFRPDQLFLNLGGLEFVDGSRDHLPGDGNQPTSIMGLDCGDFDQNGTMDLLGTRRSGDSLYLGFDLEKRYEETFRRIVEGYDATTQLTGWGVAMTDFDNDGDLDILRASNFNADGGASGSEFRLGYMTLFEHIQSGEDRRIVDVSATSGLVFDRTIDGWGLATADIDRDGDLDALVGVDGYGPGVEDDTIRAPLLLVNDGTRAADHRAISLRFRQRGKNRYAVGATVDVFGKAIGNVRVLNIGHSYLSQNDEAVHVGLGLYDVLPAVTVTWPDGGTTTWLGLAAGFHTLERPDDPAAICCSRDGCTTANSAAECRQAQGFAMGIEASCDAACAGWASCCPGMDDAVCRFLCGSDPPPPAVLTCLASADCGGLATCSQSGTLLPGSPNGVGVAPLCP